MSPPRLYLPDAATYRGPFCGACGQRIGYQGLYALPGESEWRVVRDVTGHAVRFPLNTDAEAAARDALRREASR